MTFLSIGDLAQSFQNRRHNVELKTTLQRLSRELASGQRSDISTAVTGDYSPIVGIERSLKTASAYATVTAEAALFASTMQASLALVQKHSSELGPALLTAGTSENGVMIQTTTIDARVRFGAVLSAFNARVADRYAFSGETIGTPALVDETTVLTALQAAVSAETTAAGIVAVVDAWFDDPGGGFETVAYTGSFTALSPIRLAEDENVDLSLTAANTDIREVLKGFALASLIGGNVLSGDITEQAELARSAGEKMFTSQSNLSVLRATIGTAEARIDTVTARNSARTAALEIARTEITSVDSYRAAIELEATRTQIETLYTLTARLSRLNLADFLR